MIAYELDTGRKIWKSNDRGPFHSGSVAYKDNIIYGNGHGRIFSRHQITGKLKYSVDLGASVESRGVVYKGRIFFHLRNHQIFSLDVETGKILWAYKRSVPFITTLQRVSTPVIKNEKMFVGFADGTVCAFSIEDGILLWEKKIISGSKFIDVDLSPLFFRDKLYIGSHSGGLVVLNPVNGSILQRLDYKVSRTPLIEKDKFLFGTTSGELILMDALFRPVMRKKISEAGISSISRWKKGYVVSTLKGEVFQVIPKFDLMEFETVDRFDLGHSSSAVFGQTCAAGDLLAVFSSRNRLYVFK